MEDTGALAILSRLMQATNAVNESALATILDVSAQAVYQAKKKGQIPPAWVVNVAESYKINSDWLFFGREPMRQVNAPASDPAENCFIRMDILADVVETLEEYLIVNHKTLSPGDKADLVRRLCAMIAEGEAKGLRRPAYMLRLIHEALA